MPATRAASSRLIPSSALASASRRALTRPSRSRRASARSSAGVRPVVIGTATMARLPARYSPAKSWAAPATGQDFLRPVSEPVLPRSARFDEEEQQRLKMRTAEDREQYKDDGRRYPSDLTDVEWGLVRSLFERYATLTKDLRVMVEGCLYLAGEGCRWRSLPKDFGPWQTVRGYWDRFHRDGVWADAAAVLTPAARARLGKSPAPSTGIVDSQSVASGPQRGERGVDGNKKVRGIKRHVLTCSFGFVLAV